MRTWDMVTSWGLSGQTGSISGSDGGRRLGVVGRTRQWLPWEGALGTRLARERRPGLGGLEASVRARVRLVKPAWEAGHPGSECEQFLRRPFRPGGGPPVALVQVPRQTQGGRFSEVAGTEGAHRPTGAIGAAGPASVGWESLAALEAPRWGAGGWGEGKGGDVGSPRSRPGERAERLCPRVSFPWSRSAVAPRVRALSHWGRGGQAGGPPLCATGFPCSGGLSLAGVPLPQVVPEPGPGQRQRDAPEQAG